MNESVKAIANLFDWFHAQVEDARGCVGADLTDDTSLYLTRLLVERARSDRPEPEERTLAELHAKASCAPPAQQARTYRELGDRSLYRVGYFRESLNRGIVGPSYYCDMGSAAYHRVDVVFKRFFSNAFGEVFHELAERFRDCVEVLSEVRRVCDEQPDMLVRLYQSWLETGSDEAAARLRARGLLLPPRSSEA